RRLTLSTRFLRALGLVAGIGGIATGSFVLYFSDLIQRASQVDTLNGALVRPAKFTLQPGETRAYNLDLHRSGFVDVLINDIEPEWSERETKGQEWVKEGRGNTPELCFRICSEIEGDKCPDGVQKGINGTFSRELPSGPATVVFFNFRDNPP